MEIWQLNFSLASGMIGLHQKDTHNGDDQFMQASEFSSPAPTSQKRNGGARFLKLHVTQLFFQPPKLNFNTLKLELCECDSQLSDLLKYLVSQELSCTKSRPASTYLAMSVPDMSRVPPEVQEKIRELEQELNEGGWNCINTYGSSNEREKTWNYTA